MNEKMAALLRRGGIAVVTTAALIPGMSFAADPTTLAEFSTAFQTEMGPVKTTLLAIGGILLGITALLFGIYKVLSMGGKR